MKLSRLAARAVIGTLFIGHGTQKLFGMFGGPGREGTEAMMTQLNMHPSRQQALAAGITETAGGALLALGLATPLAAASLVGVMTTAIGKVHLRNGVWAANGGFEYNLVLIATLLELVDNGPGDLSLDSVLGIERHGAAWAAGALALGAAASVAAVEIGRRSAPTTGAAQYPTEMADTAVPVRERAGDPSTAQAQG